MQEVKKPSAKLARQSWRGDTGVDHHHGQTRPRRHRPAVRPPADQGKLCFSMFGASLRCIAKTASTNPLDIRPIPGFDERFQTLKKQCDREELLATSKMRERNREINREEKERKEKEKINEKNEAADDKCVSLSSA